jgi:hypothetical protein
MKYQSLTLTSLLAVEEDETTEMEIIPSHRDREIAFQLAVRCHSARLKRYVGHHDLEAALLHLMLP